MNKLYREKTTFGVCRRERIARVASHLLIAVAVALLFVPSPSVAQRAPGSLKTEPTNPNEKPTFWLLDEDGSWRVPLPNWSLEDVMRTIDAQEEKSNVSPYTIQKVLARGEIENGVAHLDIDLTVNVESGIVRVPLGLQEGVYIPTSDEESTGASRSNGFTFDGPGFCALDVDPWTGEYVAVVQTVRKQRYPVGFNNANKPKDDDGNIATRSDSNVEKSSEEIKEQKTNSETDAPKEESAPVAPKEPSAESAPVSTEEPSSENAPVQSESATESAPVQTGEPSSENAPVSPKEPAPTALASRVFSRYAQSAESQSAKNASKVNRARPNQYVLHLKLSFVVESIGLDKYRFVASFPSSIHSELTLTVPIANASVNSTKGAIATQPTYPTEKTTNLNLRGLGRGRERTELVWQKVEEEEQTSLVYQVEKATIDAFLSARETTFEATLPVRVFGGESDVFSIRLPEDASLLADSVSAIGPDGATYALKDVSEMEPNDTRAGKIVKIELEQKTAFVTLKLKSSASFARFEESEGAEAGSGLYDRSIEGFAVLGAPKQSGMVRVVKTEDVDFDVTPRYAAAFSPDPTLNESEEAYAFFAQPFLLTAQAFRRQTIVHVKPEYALKIGEDAALYARYRYSVYGDGVAEFKVRLNDWYFLDVAKVEPFEAPKFVANETTGEYVFKLSKPADGEYVLDLNLSMPVEKDEEGVYLARLPVPVADWVEPASVVVVPGDNVELEPIKARCQGIDRKSSRAVSFEMPTPESTQPSLFFQAHQILGASSETRQGPVLAMKARKLEREIEVVAETDAVVSDKGEVRIRQNFNYTIKYETLDKFVLCAPKALIDYDNPKDGKALNLKCYVDGKLANFTTKSGDDPLVTIVEIPLGELGKIGNSTVNVQYDYPKLDLLTRSTKKVELLFAQPQDDQRLVNNLKLTYPKGMGLLYESTNEFYFELEEQGVSDGSNTCWARFHSVNTESSFKCYLTDAAAESGVSRSAIVERAWIQSWFGKDARVDRCAYRFSTAREFIEIRLPQGVRNDQVSASIDGAPFRNVASADGGLFSGPSTLRIPTTEEQRKRDFVLEISCVVPYSNENSMKMNGRCKANLPVVAGNTWVRRAYWQAISPYSRQIVNAPDNWTPEYSLRRVSSFGFYCRDASLSSRDLAKWVGVDREEPIPAESRVYLYSAFGQPATTDFFMMETTLLVAFGSGVALFIGLGLLYFPSARSPIIWFLLSLGALALSALQPTLSLLFLQTTALGVALTLLTLLANRVFNRAASRSRDSDVARRTPNARTRGSESQANGLSVD